MLLCPRQFTSLFFPKYLWMYELPCVSTMESKTTARGKKCQINSFSAEKWSILLQQNSSEQHDARSCNRADVYDTCVHHCRIGKPSDLSWQAWSQTECDGSFQPPDSEVANASRILILPLRDCPSHFLHQCLLTELEIGTRMIRWALQMPYVSWEGGLKHDHLFLQVQGGDNGGVSC